MGSSRRKKCAPFVMLEKATLKSDEWQQLSLHAKYLYMKIKAKFNGTNNGKIAFRYSEIRGEDKFKSDATISKYLKELISKGWIDKTEHGGLFRYYCLYRLTGKCDQIRHG